MAINTSEDLALCKPTLKVNNTQVDAVNKSPLCCKHGPVAWCRKYFWEGQLKQGKSEDESEVDETLQYNCWVSFFKKHRRLIGFTFPILFFHVFWWGVVIQHELLHLFKDKWYMSITMLIGSIVAGMTTEGGGAIAFPVMTLAFKIQPSVARDFSLMIQSCGMAAATVTILLMRIRLEWNSLVWCTLGGSAGMIFGLELIDPHLTSSQKKMGFVSLWFSFAFALFLLNRYHKRKTFTTIPYVTTWKVFVLIIVGFMGGVTTSFAGSGLDICSFSILTLFFRISEKVATPTSVILMAGNSLVGFYWRGVMMQEISTEAWDFFIVCIPIVVIGAPFGSVLGSHFHRLVLAALIYVIDTIALISAFILVHQTPTLIAISISIILGGFVFFLVLTKLGQIMLKRQTFNAPNCNQLSADLEKGEEKNTITENGHCKSDSNDLDLETR